ncbi:MAG: hypothetical protein DRQ88_11220 [Epsilonproteobacteria bacterium]|nr:MAG: hypothetical protein DRQ88_11220 [Campylobacterota bacterium]RLA64913.1 MAG: hypothetical protein DRQ89_02510 [Campylobacterota bacterium]
MKNKLTIKILFICFGFLLNLSVSSAKVFSVKELGIPPSKVLKTEINEKFYSNGVFDFEKLKDFERSIHKSRKIFIQNRLEALDPQESFVEAEAKLKNKKAVKAYDNILARIEHFKNLDNPLEKQNALAEILTIRYATKNNSGDALIKEMIKGQINMMFVKYDVPRNDLKRPMPSNLVNEGKGRYFKKEELQKMLKQGVDLSKLNPPNNAFWKRPHNISEMDPITSIEKTKSLPTELNFKKLTQSQTQPKFKATEILMDGSKRTWKVKIGREIQPEYVGAQLMKLVGYNFDENFIVEDLKIYFKSKKQLDKFIKGWLEYYYDFYTLPFDFIKEQGVDEKGHYAVFYEALLESRPKEVLRVGKLHLQEMGNYERREIRAQLLMQALIGNSDYKQSKNNLVKLIENPSAPGGYEMQELVQDLGYSFGFVWPNEPNVFPWSFIKKKGKKIKLDYVTNEMFKSKKNPLLNASYSDMKWMARFLVQITQKQLKAILSHSKWPYPVQVLILEKIKFRRNEVVRTFDLEGKIIEGKRVTLWNEADPETFAFGEFIKEGALVKDYKPINKPHPYTDLFQFPTEILQSGNMLLEMLYSMNEDLPFHEMVKHPFEVNGFETTQFFVGAGFGFRFKREIVKNPDAKEGPMTWITKDTLQIFGTIGGSISIPVTETITGSIEGKTLIGKQFEVSYHSGNFWKAMKGDIKKVASLPFKKRNIINELKDGESYSSGIFVGLEFEEGMVWGPHQTFGVGFEFEQNLKWLNKTEVLKTGPGKYEVTQARSKDFTFGFSTFIQLVSILNIDIFSASVMLGESEGNTFYFDLEADKSFKMKEVFHKLVFGRNVDIAKEMVPYSQMQMQYYEKKWKLGFLLAHIGSETKGTYKFIKMPDGTMKRSFDYKSVLDTNKAGDAMQFFEVNGRLEFADEDLTEVTKQALNVEYKVNDGETTFKEMDSYIYRVNHLVNKKRFVTNDFYDNFINHLGITSVHLQMEFQEDALSCMFQRKKCVAQGPKAYKIDSKLKRIAKIKGPAKKMEKLGRMLRKYVFFPDKFKHILDFVGQNNISADLIISGENFTGKDAIIRKKVFKMAEAI